MIKSRPARATQTKTKHERLFWTEQSPGRLKAPVQPVPVIDQLLTSPFPLHSNICKSLDRRQKPRATAPEVNPEPSGVAAVPFQAYPTPVCQHLHLNTAHVGSDMKNPLFLSVTLVCQLQDQKKRLNYIVEGFPSKVI